MKDTNICNHSKACLVSLFFSKLSAHVNSSTARYSQHPEALNDVTLKQPYQDIRSEAGAAMRSLWAASDAKASCVHGSPTPHPPSPPAEGLLRCLLAWAFLHPTQHTLLHWRVVCIGTEADGHGGSLVMRSRSTACMQTHRLTETCISCWKEHMLCISKKIICVHALHTARKVCVLLCST